MVLVDHIEGITMADAKLSNFSKSVPQSMLRSIVDLESPIFEKGIWLTDLEPRNVIISSPDSDKPSVVCIDFAHALFNRGRDDPPLLQLNYFLGEYVSPSFGGRKSEAKEIQFQDGLIGIGALARSRICKYGLKHKARYARTMARRIVSSARSLGGCLKFGTTFTSGFSSFKC